MVEGGPGALATHEELFVSDFHFQKWLQSLILEQLAIKKYTLNFFL